MQIAMCLSKFVTFLTWVFNMDFEKYVKTWVDAGLYKMGTDLLERDAFIPASNLFIFCWFDADCDMIYHKAYSLVSRLSPSTYLKICHLSYMGI